MKTRSVTKMVMVLAMIIIFIYFGMIFLMPKVSDGKSHVYQISVNNQQYMTSDMKIDSVANRISFTNVLGQTITAPLDRTVIIKLY